MEVSGEIKEENQLFWLLSETEVEDRGQRSPIGLRAELIRLSAKSVKHRCR